MKQVRLIVNADDFARSAGINRGILQAHDEGIVSTTTVMLNLEGAQEQIISAARRAPKLGFGVHLNISHGSPISSPAEVSSLLNDKSRFKNFREVLSTPEGLNINQVECEWRNQIERFLETNIPLDHLDSHHHSAIFSKDLFYLLLDLASEYGCGVRNPYPSDLDHASLLSLYDKKIIRFVQEEASNLMREKKVPHPDGFLASFFADKATLEHLINLLQGLKPGVYELMCHPGFFEAALAKESSYASFREQELAILTHPDILNVIRDLDIRLHTYRSAWMA